MKKLTLLKPDRKTVYLDHGRGQEVDYLNISAKLTKEALEKDVKAGAALYKDCLSFAEKKSSRVVIMECDTEEEGLMAASYLAGIYNWKDEAFESWMADCVETPEDSSETFEGLSLDDYKDIEQEQDFEEEEFRNGTFGAEWEESPYMLPIIPLGQLTMYSNNSSIFQERDMFLGGTMNESSNRPYWLTANHESVCILAHESYGFCWNPDQMDESLTKELKRFQTNRHVYVVVVRDARFRKNGGPIGLLGELMDDDEADNQPRNPFCEVILEYTAGLFDVACSEKERQKYYQLVFENWAHVFGKKLEKRFPKNQIVDQVLEMKNPNKSGLIEKIYRYVLSEETVGDTLKIEDFHILKRFKMLGMMDEKKDRRKTILKMESDLVGMDDVKRQVYEIVDVMKFNKKRAQMGLGSGGFHNVHLLIGAPGTAKTTIAQMMGDIMCEQKLLSGNRFVSINGADLKGMFVGHSAPKTRRYFEDYDIIFIDEAYSLTSERDMDSFSQEALAQLIIELEKHGLDRLVLFAGYGGKNVQDKDNKMNQFLNANPGIRSRINSTIFFNSYTPDEMVEIVHRQAKNQKYVLSHDADELIRTFFEERVKATDFGNGREARSLLENITMKAAVRTMANQDSQITKTMLQKLTAEDVKLALGQIRSSYSQQLGRRGKEYGFKMGE